MHRRTLLQQLAILVLAPLLPACAAAPDPASTAGSSVKPLDTPKQHWRKLLSPAAYGVLFNEDTERSGSSPLNDEKRTGTFLCAACLLPLFDAAHKFESGTGWPSFTQPIAGHVATSRDYKMILPRTEYHCARCGGHQGHVFNDGPPPRGERWCNNGLALNFVPEGKSLPPLRS